MSRPDGLPSVVAAELDRLNPSRVVLVGDYAALSTAVARGAARYSPSVSRVSGERAVDLAGPQPGRVHARRRRPGSSAAPAGTTRSSAPWRPRRTAPPSSSSTAPPPTCRRANASLLRDLGVTSVTVVGPPAAVSSGIAADLAGIVGASKVVRAAGSDRYATAARVNALAWPDMAPGTAYLADGTDITNGIGGALLAGRTKRPLYWTVPYCTPSSRAPGARRPGRHPGDAARRRGLGPRLLAGRLETCRSIDTASSVWVLVNKRNGLDPKSFVPSNLVVPSMPYADGHQLRSDAAAALARMAVGLLRRGGRPDRHRHRLPLVRHPEGALRQVPRPQGTDLDRHLVPARRVQRAPDRPHRRPAAHRALELPDQRLHRRDPAGRVAREERVALRLHPALREGPDLHDRGRLRAVALPLRRRPRWPRRTTTAAGTPTSSSSASRRPRTY